MVKKCILMWLLGMQGVITASQFFFTLASINKQLFYDNLAGNSNEYWMRLPHMSSFVFMTHLNDLYQKNYTDELLQSRPRIPLVVHQIWIGPKIPKHLISMVAIWQQLPAPWQYKLWTEKEIDALGLVNRDLYDNAANYAEKSDIARYEILARFGGVYADCDVTLVRPEELQKLHMNYDFYAGLEQLSEQRTFSIGNSLIGAVPNHPVIVALVENMSTWNGICTEYYLDEYQSGRVIEKWEPTCLRTGPGYLSAMFYEHGTYDGVYRNIIFPPDTFYPYDFTPDKPDIIAWHKYELSWLKKKFSCATDLLSCPRELYDAVVAFLAQFFSSQPVPPYYEKTIKP